MKKIFIATAIIFLTACNTSENQKPANTSSNKEKPVETAIVSVSGSTQITVTITGGANAGTYTATSAEPTCSMGLTGPKSFGNQYSVSGKAANEFSSLQLIVDDYRAAKSGTEKFYIKVAFGKILQGAAYEINGSENSLAGKKQGSGKLTLMESGNSKTVHAAGKTAAGIAIIVDITCLSTIAEK